MTQQDSSEDKRFPPSARQLRQARQRGEVTHSADVSSALVFSVLVLLLWLLAGSVFELIHGLWLRATDPHVFKQPGTHLAALLRHAGLVWLVVGGAVMATAALAAAAGSFVQVGALAAWSRLVPRAERLNPGQGWRRLMSVDNWVQLGILLLKTLLVALLLAAVLRAQLPTALRLGHLPVAGQLEVAARLVLLLLASAAVIQAAMAPLDWLHRRHQFIKRHRMSLVELRREVQESDGHPLVLQRRREDHHETVFESATDRLERATLLVHSGRLVIGLQYLSADELPRIVLRAEGEMALHVRRLAAVQRLYDGEDPALAEALHREGGLDVFAPQALAQPLRQLLQQALGTAAGPQT